ncbi:hypothetical protein, conserved [Leishmania tarentolae]|uniref:Uncharacterized protein n=1 Tax=Leishmania tarentolae TaxID=5689 RepID=A0A640KCX4_LEITA|nr:hypothetical protein, conserved [Leishmania tarentolae]
MTGLPLTRSPSYDMERLSTSVAGSCPSASTPFKYLIASREVTRYQHPSFRSLELLLPASLWSDSFLQARARYTLLPQQPSPLLSPSSSVTREPSSSCALDDTSRTARTSSALEEQRSANSADVGSRLSGKWSFIEIYRNFKRARETATTCETVVEVPRRARLAERAVVEDALLSEYPPRTFSPSTSYFPSPSMSVVDGYSDTGVDHGDDHGEGVNVQGRGRSSSCSSSSTTPPAESIVASEVGTSHALVRECQMALSASSATAVAAASLNGPHAEALRVFETVLDRVSTSHETCCPLCSPPQPPRWGSCAQSVLLNRPLPARAVVSDLPDAHELPPTVEKQAETEAHRQRLLQRAHSLLNRHDDRLRYLSETKPSLVREAAQSHPLARACAQVGGLELVRALSATL